MSRAPAAALVFGVVLAAGAHGARAEAPTTPAAPACAHDPGLEAAVARQLKKKVRAIEPTPGARIEITFACPALAGPRQVTALLANGHGGFVSVLDLDGTGQVHALRLQPAAAPALAGPPPKITRAASRPRDEALRRGLAFANAALAATIRVELPPAVPGALQTVAARATTHDEAIEIRLGDQGAARRWNGYVDSTHAAERVPLEVAWEALWDLGGGHLQPGPVDDAGRAAFQRLIDGHGDGDGARPRFLTDGLLELGAVLATPRSVPSLTASLQAPSPRTQTLAVNALATATGTDLRRDATGALRPLPDVVAAYRAQAAQPR